MYSSSHNTNFVLVYTYTNIVCGYVAMYILMYIDKTITIHLIYTDHINLNCNVAIRQTTYAGAVLLAKGTYVVILHAYSILATILKLATSHRFLSLVHKQTLCLQCRVAICFNLHNH